MDNTQQPPLTAISIGPGIRGIERGVSRVVRLREIAFVEREAYIAENLVAQMEAGLLDPAVIWSDAKTFPAHLFRGRVNLLLAGYPCQPFSSAGQRKGVEDERHLYPYIERTIDIIRPDACFFENVRGHVTLGLREVVESLERLGYRVHWGIFSAEETGASHKRERVFILAIRNSSITGLQKGDGLPESTITAESSELANTNYRSVNNRSGRNGDSIKEEEVQERNEDKESCKSNSLGHPQHEPVNSSIGGIQGESDPTGSEELENTRHSGVRRRCHDGINWGCEIQTTGSGKLGDTNDQGLEGRISGQCEECSGEWLTRKNGPFFRVSRPGQPQQAWEHPRVISRKVESAVGLSAHGYHFREDVLRALGNSVYEDTAELAFRTLLMKFL